jgi:eukaryotic-like serine/threonine-protein kinase
MDPRRAGGCLGDETILELLGPAPPPAGVHEHLASCSACRELWVHAAEQTLSDVPIDSGAATAETVPTEIGRYHVRHELGRGGMGIVYSAFDPHLHRDVALKLLRADVFGDKRSAWEGRLLREARAMAQLADPHVVVVHDVGTFEGHVFVAMELVKGRTLREWQAERERSTEEILDAFLQAGRGLRAAHRAGLVHRDFKPANVLVGDDGRVRVTDFGLVRPERSDEPRPSAAPHMTALTRTGGVVGTPAYMSPEQFRREDADARSDQFSFSVALYEALYGERPFRAKNTKELAEAVINGRRRPVPRSANVPTPIRDALLRGLATDPSARFPSMDAMLEALTQRRTRRAPILVAASIGVLGIAIALGARAMHRESPAEVPTARIDPPKPIEEPPPAIVEPPVASPAAVTTAKRPPRIPTRKVAPPKRDDDALKPFDERGSK